MLSRRVIMQTLYGATVLALAPTKARSDTLEGSAAFRQVVLALLDRRHPEWHATVGNDAMTIMIGHFEIYLGNIYLHVREMPQARRDDEIVSFIEYSVNVTSRTGDMPLAEARSQLRLQIVPAEYRERSHDLVFRPLEPFLADLIVAYALDDEKAYQLLRQPMLDGWNIGRSEVEAIAVENLETISSAIALEAKDGDSGGYVTVSILDGYDAVRILLPRFMSRLRKVLKVPTVFVGIPNRDFLVAWTPDFAGRRGFAAQIARDVTKMPHPLTETLFVASETGLRLANSSELRDHGRE